MEGCRTHRHRFSLLWLSAFHSSSSDRCFTSVQGKRTFAFVRSTLVQAVVFARGRLGRVPVDLPLVPFLPAIQVSPSCNKSTLVLPSFRLVSHPCVLLRSHPRVEHVHAFPCTRQASDLVLSMVSLPLDRCLSLDPSRSVD